jgi:hypothetical protein
MSTASSKERVLEEMHTFSMLSALCLWMRLTDEQREEILAVVVRKEKRGGKALNEFFSVINTLDEDLKR